MLRVEFFLLKHLEIVEHLAFLENLFYDQLLSGVVRRVLDICCFIQNFIQLLSIRLDVSQGELTVFAANWALDLFRSTLPNVLHAFVHSLHCSF